MQGLAWKPKGDHFEDLGVDGRIILIWLLETGWYGVNWIRITLDRDRWRAMNTVMNLWVRHSAGNFLTS